MLLLARRRPAVVTALLGAAFRNRLRALETRQRALSFLMLIVVKDGNTFNRYRTSTRESLLAGDTGKPSVPRPLASTSKLSWISSRAEPLAKNLSFPALEFLFILFTCINTLIEFHSKSRFSSKNTGFEQLQPLCTSAIYSVRIQGYEVELDHRERQGIRVKSLRSPFFSSLSLEALVA